MKTITCTIDKKTGNVTISAEGYTGADCLAATLKLEKGLGLTGEHQYKPEFFEEVKEEQQVGEPGGAFPKGRWT